MDRIPSPVRAQTYLDEAEKLNPGEWVDHVGYVAKAARPIGRKHPEVDPDKAYALGLLHDIGRRVGRVGMRHIVEGYKLLLADGFPDAARICLTHSFPCKEVELDFSKWDCPIEDGQLVRDYLDEIDYNVYDRLLQLCDALGTTTGFCLIEKRIVSAAIRHAGSWDATNQTMKWRATFEIRSEFEQAIGCSIYEQLPGVVENTFGFTTSS